MTAQRVDVMKELHKLLRKADKLYDGQVEFVLNHGEKINANDDDEGATDGDDYLLDVFFFVTPRGGMYRNARVKFHMEVDTRSYPQTPPEISCRNRIYHPNIDYLMESEKETGICVNVLDNDWEPEVGLDGAVMAVLFLMYNPELDDALSPVCQDYHDSGDFAANVRKSLRGEEVGGYSFDPLLKERSDWESELELAASDEKALIDDKDNNNEESTTKLSASTVTTVNTKKGVGADVSADKKLPTTTSTTENTDNQVDETLDNEANTLSSVEILPTTSTMNEEDTVPSTFTTPKPSKTADHVAQTTAAKIAEDKAATTTIDYYYAYDDTYESSINVVITVFKLGFTKLKDYLSSIRASSRKET